MTDHTKPIEKLRFHENFWGMKTQGEGFEAVFEKVDEIVDRVNYIQGVQNGSIPAQQVTVRYLIHCERCGVNWGIPYRETCPQCGDKFNIEEPKE